MLTQNALTQNVLTENIPAQTFEFADDHFAPSSEQRVIGMAKIACVLLAGVSLTFSVLDIADIRSLGEVSNLWHLKVRPVFASAIATSDAEILRAEEGYSVVVKTNLDFSRPARTASPASPYVLPDVMPVAAAAPLPQPVPAARPSAARANAPLASERVRPQLMALASASPDDLLSAPPLERKAALDPMPKLDLSQPKAPASAPVASITPPPALEAPVSPLMLTTPFPSLDLVPLPRPAPAREAESHEPTPAELLGLDINPKERAKAERCLANAVYFESRSEPLRGQMAVAQVVMNRVFSPFYPKDVCGVVYQNAGRHLSCQFTFACDGKSKAIHDRGSWARANRIAKQTLDGKLWISEVAKSTHYHAMYVRPNWIHEMRRMFKTGLHLFYRPYNWGDGSDEQGWVKPIQTATAKH